MTEMGASLLAQQSTAEAEEMEGRYGDQVALCYQCKRCTAGCPVADAMDIRPHQVVRLVQLGGVERLLSSQAIWTCVGCYLCAARCPQGVPVTEMIYALKGMAIKRGIPSRGATVPTFISAFARTVERSGRIRELPMIARFYLGTDPMEALRHREMGLKLFRQGRLPLFGERDSGSKAVKAMLQRARRREKRA